jgi:hypothetical protein
VPVDVRVVDSKGDPVTDLKKEDFTVTEDGIPQQVRLFDPGSAKAGKSAAASESPAG